MKHTQVTCDFCGDDLSHTDNCVGYRLVLSSEGIPNPSNMATLTEVPNPMPQGAAHFCGKRCLRAWVLRETHETATNIG